MTTTTDGIDTEFAFGRFRVLPRRRELLVDGIPVELGTRAFDVLLMLIEAGGALVTKDEMLERAWPGVVVEENNLQVQISALRRALGEDRGLILTAPGRGYRFTAEVTVTRAAPEMPPQGDGRGIQPSADAASLTNLPAAISDLIGRETEVGELQELIATHRLVTVIGAGGIGKTRLGVEVARRLLPEFPDGVWLVELAPLADPELVRMAVASALGLQAGADAKPADRRAAALRTKRLLLILDNCEHVIAAAAREAESLLHGAPGLRVLATSQEPLAIEGECIYRLPPLGVPAEDIADADSALRHGAVRLFVARAQTAGLHLPFDNRTAAAVAGICRRLDGIPLAIELAAARAATLGVEELAARLDNRFLVLAGGRRTALPRHQTLRATLDWSYGLLGEIERTVLRRLAIFAGGFTLDAAGAVAAASMADSEVVGRIADLVAKSLVSVETGSAGPRYRLLETMRLYALEKLGESGEFQTLAQRHAEYYRDLMSRAEATWEATRMPEWLGTYAPEIDNVRTAFDWAFGSDHDRRLAMELIAASERLWYLMSLLVEGRGRFQRVLDDLGADVPKPLEAKLWVGYGFLSTDHPRGRALPALERAVALFRQLDDPVGLGRTLDVLGLTLARAGRVEEGEVALTEACALLAGSSALKSYARSLTDSAVVRLIAGRTGDARSLIDRALRVGHIAGADYWGLRTLVYAAEIDFVLGDVERAIAGGRNVVARCRSLRRSGLLGHVLCNLAGYLIAGDALAEAIAAVKESLPLAHEGELGSVIVALGIQHLATIAAHQRRFELSAQLAGYSEAFFAAEFLGRNPSELKSRERLMARLREAVPAETLARWVAEGAAWPEEQAVAAALAA
jgi:predicted ATPase/DNA-binding winged helix-turn-helix (wHTH) protein